MTRRQATAYSTPLDRAEDLAALRPLMAQREERGLLLRTILAVDR